jgi:dienelactone hydrolase
MTLRPMFAALLLLASGCAGGQEPEEASASADLSTTLDGGNVFQAVQFPGKGVTLSAAMFVPPAPPMPAKRRPAVVLLHGCGGMVDARGEITSRQLDWAKRMADWGFVALAVDSFGPRGIRSVCDLNVRPIQPWRERVSDAYSALDYLAARADVDPKNIFMVGWSDGGSVATGAVRPEAIEGRVGTATFKRALAFYPACNRALQEPSYHLTMPLLILHGAADDWNRAEACTSLADRVMGERFPVQTILYPHAFHGFDEPTGEVKFLPDVFNPTVPSGKGGHFGRDERARRTAIGDVERFLKQGMPPL